MRSFTCTPEQLPELMAREEAGIRAAILDGLQAGAERGRILVMKATPLDQGEARRGWEVHRDQTGVDLRNDTVHAAVHELGRRPGEAPPPLAPILEWVERHAAELGIGNPRSQVAGRRRVGPPLPSEGGTPEAGADPWLNDLFETALAIRAAIGRDGLPALRMVGSRLEELGELAQREVRRELGAR